MIRLTREEIYQLVWEQPMTEIAKKYIISDVGFRKQCIRMNIPIPIAGYWAKVRVGQRIKRPLLPAKCKGPAFVDLAERPPEQPVKNVSELKAMTKVLATKKLPFKVPDRLTNPDPLVVTAKASLTRMTNVNHPGMAVTAKGELDIRVSPTNAGRALRFMDTMLKCVRARGYVFELDKDGNYIVVRNIRLKVSFRERTTRVKVSDRSYDNYQWHPNGQVIFRLDGRLKAEWQDLKTQFLEDQLPKIIAKLELTAKQEETYLEKARQWQEAWQRECKAKAEREERQQQELKNLKQLLKDAKLWKQAELIREYLISHKSADPQWLAWAMHKADWMDPLVMVEDEWLSGVDKNSL
jgi:hypothetical protein